MLELIKYILQDINQVLGYALWAGCITAVLSFGYVLFCKGTKRKLGNRKKNLLMGLLVFYVILILIISIFSREPGSRVGVSLIPGETWTRENKIVGLGSVYLINLLFFLSHGKCPIYDRFAMASLRAYEEGLSPVEYKGKPPVKVPNLPDKNSKRFETICENGAYAEYIEKLDALGVDYKEDRRLDRALWVYGHAFEIEEGKCC